MFELSQKYVDFCNTVEGVSADFLEGTTASGKTTIGASVKFMLMVSRSEKKQHIIASKTTGTAEKNILQSDNGILSFHTNAVYYGNGDKDVKIPHIKFEGKIIYILGYDDVSKWKMVLGSQFGCVLIDEVNTANIEFVREISTRNDYMMCTLNPDNPELPVYKEFVNRARPYKKYAGDVPRSIMEELKEDPVPDWKYWFFSFNDNLGLTEDDIEKKKRSAPPGTKMHKNKILGLRGKATGVVFVNFDRKRHVRSKEWVKKQLKDGKFKFIRFVGALDTSYSQKSPDTIAMTYIGITDTRKVVLLDEKVYNNAELETPIAPSDTVKNFIDFLNRNKDEWGLARDTYIDNADQATITEFNKYKRLHGSIYNFHGSFKKMKIVDRINLQLGWFAHDDFIVLEHCTNYMHELEVYSWNEKKDNEPEDGNDHLINSCQYGWLPFHKHIGNGGDENED